MITYQFPGFRLEFEPNTGDCFTHYPDGYQSGCGIVDGDRFHAARLGITPQMHRLAHELTHHMTALARGYAGSGNGCRIVWRDAHGEPQESPEAELDEWKITAVTYYVHDMACDWGALMDLEEEGVDVVVLRDTIRYLLSAVHHHPVRLHIFHDPTP